MLYRLRTNFLDWLFANCVKYNDREVEKRKALDSDAATSADDKPKQTLEQRCTKPSRATNNDKTKGDSATAAQVQVIGSSKRSDHEQSLPKDTTNASSVLNAPVAHMVSSHRSNTGTAESTHSKTNSVSADTVVKKSHTADKVKQATDSVESINKPAAKSSRQDVGSKRGRSVEGVSKSEQRTHVKRAKLREPEESALSIVIPDSPSKKSSFETREMRRNTLFVEESETDSDSDAPSPPSNIKNTNESTAIKASRAASSIIPSPLRSCQDSTHLSKGVSELIQNSSQYRTVEQISETSTAPRYHAWPATPAASGMVVTNRSSIYERKAADTTRQIHPSQMTAIADPSKGHCLGRWVSNPSTTMSHPSPVNPYSEYRWPTRTYPAANQRLESDVARNMRILNTAMFSTKQNLSRPHSYAPVGMQGAVLPHARPHQLPQGFPLMPASGMSRIGPRIPQQPHLMESKERRRLNIKLVADESSCNQYVTAELDISVEDLFSKVQKRLDRRLSGQRVPALEVRLLGEEGSSGISFFIERDDPDTWENFVERAAEMNGGKIQAVADVQI